MTDNLKRPNLKGREVKDYHKHCRNIARIITETDSPHSIEARIRHYLLAVGIVST